jgi:hypothetical protein
MDKDHKKFMETTSTCFWAVLMQPPTHPNICALSPTCPTPLSPSSQLQSSTFGTREISTTTGVLLVLTCLIAPSCEQSWKGFVRPTMLNWRMCNRSKYSLTPQMRSASVWTCLITQGSIHPFPFFMCWCLASNAIQITLSISTTCLFSWYKHSQT